MSALAAAAAAALLASALLACSAEPVDRSSIVALLASDTPRPELGELFWEGQRRQGSEVWGYASNFCRARPERPNCAPVLNLLSIRELTEVVPEESP